MSNNISINQDNRNFLVYKHTNKVNGKVYIGITHHEDPNKRWLNGRGYTPSQTHMYNAVKTYGWDNFEHEIIQENLSEQEALLLEEKLIAEYDSTNREKGYNELLSSVKSHPKFTNESKEKMSNSKKGIKNPMYHKEVSEETKEKIRQTKLGTHRTEETKEKIRQYKTGKPMPEEVKEKIRKSMIGRKCSPKAIEATINRCLGSHLSEETKLKIGNKIKGTHWFNNGTIEVHTTECPEGFCKGRLSKPRPRTYRSSF